MVLSTTAAGIINQTARGFVSFFTKSSSEDDPIAFSRVNSITAFGNMSKITHSCPARRSRRVMFAPILPRPIMPICIVCFWFGGDSKTSYVVANFTLLPLPARFS